MISASESSFIPHWLQVQVVSAAANCRLKTTNLSAYEMFLKIKYKKSQSS